MRDIKFRAWNGERMQFMGRGGFCDFELAGGDIYAADSVGYQFGYKD